MFRAHIELNFPSFFKAKILIGCSGGLDSMVLVNLCQTLDLNISLAHCNFCLRGSESEADLAFVEAYGKKITSKYLQKPLKQNYSPKTQENLSKWQLVNYATTGLKHF